MTVSLGALVARWREEAATFRRYGDELHAAACDLHADELETALAAAQLESVTLQEAARIGGYSYSHLQHLVADDKIPNVGTKGAPRIRRADVPVKPGGAGSQAPVPSRLDAILPLRRVR